MSLCSTDVEHGATTTCLCPVLTKRTLLPGQTAPLVAPLRLHAENVTEVSDADCPLKVQLLVEVGSAQSHRKKLVATRMRVGFRVCFA